MIVIKTPQTKEEFKEYYALRYRILREPWGQPKGTEKDDYEPISYHFMAVDSDTGEVVGVVKLFEKEAGVGQFSHMAVAEKFQRKGIGHILMMAVESTAREQGYKILGTMSRLTSTRFFEKYGFAVKGLPTHYFGTTQLIWMERELEITSKAKKK